MNTNRHELILGSEAHQIVGCAMEVLNTLGHGLLEKPYENALVVEFELQDISYRQQPRFEVEYKSVKVGEYVMEFRIAVTFTDSLAKLTGDEQKSVKTTAFDLQLNPPNPGMQFHKLDSAKNPTTGQSE